MADGMLSRAQMEDAVKAGGSVEYKGRIISTLEGLPTAAQLGGVDDLKEENARLERQLEQNQKALADAEKAAKAAEKADAERKAAAEEDEKKSGSRKQAEK